MAPCRCQMLGRLGGRDAPGSANLPVSSPAGDAGGTRRSLCRGPAGVDLHPDDPQRRVADAPRGFWHGGLLRGSVSGTVRKSGARRAITFFVLAALLAFTAEALGDNFGLLFGNHHYTAALGPRLLGSRS